MSKSYCAPMNLNAVLNMEPQRAGRLLSSAEVKAHALILKLRGYVVLPCCDNHDRKGLCLGHYTEAHQD